MKAIAWILGTTLCGVLVALAALVMTAGGHGWGATFVSATAILTGPAGGAAWLRRRRGFALVVVAIHAVIDTAFLVLAAREGLASVASMLEHVAPLVIAWAVVWVALQVPPALVALGKRQ